MTDDELDRALCSLPLEEPPVGLRARILAATVYRPPATAAFKTWEWWLLGVALAVVALITIVLLTSAPQAPDRASAAFAHALRELGLFRVTTYAWVAAGVSCVWAISSLSLMPRVPTGLYNR